ncbi:MAG: GNAT family N-acetyltransferase [Thermoleophilia bacterium]|nr:GNAT family N-acetyltransferase [Thermoleophilia bacterium]
MDIEVRPCASLEELRDALNAIGHSFGFENEFEDAERFARWIEMERMHAAFQDGRVVGGAGAFSFQMSVPGGASVPAAGVTVVGVLPTHRRRGALRASTREQLADARARGDVAAYLWASEGTIYGRYGYGVASRMGSISLPHERSAFAAPFEPRGTVRIVDLEEAARTFPPLYERVRAQRPGMFERSKDWWETRRLFDDPRRRQGGPKHRALLELDGEPAGYAIYSVKQDWRGGSSTGAVNLVEVITPTPEAARELWRWLLDFDWTSELNANVLPLDHELFQLLAEPRRMKFTVHDGVWVRMIDVGSALSARTFNDGEIVLEVEDAFLRENAGRWRVTPAGAERTDEAADLRLDVAGIGSVYLGGFTFRELVWGSRAEELADDAAARADAVFGTDVEPWCAEIF